MKDRNGVVDRIAAALPEARLEHRLSQRALEAYTGVPRWTIARAERGEHVDPAKLIKLGTALLVLDAFAPPRDEDDLAAPAPVFRSELLAPPRALLAQPRSTLLPALPGERVAS